MPVSFPKVKNSPQSGRRGGTAKRLRPLARVREYDTGLRRMHVFPQPSLVRASLAPHQSKDRGANLETDNLLGSNSCLGGPSVIFSKD